MSQYSKQLYLFEPQKEVAANLQKTLNLNHITHARVFNFGLSNNNGELLLYKNLRSNIETSFVPDIKDAQFCTEEASVRVGDEIIKEHQIEKIDFIKVDVEGFEANVITGLQHSIKKFRPIVFMEWDKDITRKNFKEHKLLEKVFSGYVIKAVIRNPAESSLLKKIYGTIRRIPTRKGTRQRWVIGEFDFHKDYRHAVFVPLEKSHVLLPDLATVT